MSHQDLIDIMSKRMVEAVSHQNVTLDTFMHVEGANLLFYPEDRDNFVNEKKQYQKSMAERDKCTEAWQVDKKQTAPPPEPVPARPRARRTRGGNRDDGGPPPSREIPDEDITQAQFKHRVLPGGHIWIGNQMGTWNSH